MRPQLTKREWLTLAALAALVGICFFFRLGGVPLLGKDEPRYAEVAREMFATGDWITPRLAGHTWFEKPALPYWMMAAGFSVLGVTELAARLGSAVLAALGVAVVYLMGRRAAGPWRGTVAAAALTTSALWFAFARGASFDMPLAGTMAAALGCFYAMDTAERPRARLGWAAAAGAWAGASMLAKGLAGPLLLGMIVVAYLVVTGAWRRLRAGEVVLATGAALAVAAVWYVPVWQRNGDVFVQEFFVDHHFKRYLTNKYHHPQPVWFYPLVVLGGLLPWTFFLVSSVRRFSIAVLRRSASADERLVWLAALWSLIPLAFFSLSTSKLPGYILPVFPGLALLVAWSVDRTEDDGRGRWAYWGAALTLLGLGTGLAIYAGNALRAPAWEVALVGLPLAAAGAGTAIAARRGSPKAAVWTTAAGGAAAVVLVATFLFGEVAHREALADLSTLAGRELRSGEVVLVFGVVEYGPAFYTEGRVVVDDKGEILIGTSFEQVADAIDASAAGSLLCVTDTRRAAELERDGRFRTEQLGQQRDRVLLRVVEP